MTGLRLLFILPCLLLLSLLSCSALPSSHAGAEQSLSLTVDEQLAKTTSCLYEPQTGSLNLADIRKWLASVTKELNYTYITVDSGKTMIRESTVFGADAKLATTGTKTKKIWTSNSPLKNACVKIFLSKFKSSKPTIYVSHISDMGSTAELQCMAKLVYNKIKVKSMDWESFANPLSKACKDLIMNTLNGASFKAAQNKLNEQIAEINNMSKSSNASQFCK